MMKTIEQFAIKKALEEDVAHEEQYLEYMRENGSIPSDCVFDHYTPMGFIGSLLLVVEPSDLLETIEKWFSDFGDETHLNKEHVLALHSEYFEIQKEAHNEV